MNIVIAVAIFIAVLCIIEGVFLVVRSRLDPERRRLKRELRLLTQGPTPETVSMLTRNRPLSNIPWLNDLLLKLPWLAKIDDLLLQANTRYPLGAFLLASLLLAAIGFYLGLLCGSVTLGLCLCVLGGVTFGLMAISRKNRRMRKLEEQLPDALDLMARSLRAGHALSGGLQMVAQEFDDPIGPEFNKTLGQIALGVSLEQALKNLCERVDCPDLRFFAVSIIIQKESGGNLAEILESIANLIRARFRLRGKIRTLSAEGRYSTIVLVAIPFFIVVALAVVSPDYIKVLFIDPVGQILVGVALIMIIIGGLLMKRMIAIKV